MTLRIAKRGILAAVLLAAPLAPVLARSNAGISAPRPECTTPSELTGNATIESTNPLVE